MSKLSEKALLVRHKVGVWSGKMHDPKTTQEILSIKSAQTMDAGKFSKMLIHARNLAPVQAICRAARKHHAQVTLPWYDSGDRSGMRLLPSTIYMEYQAQQGRYKTAFERAVLEFCRQYPAFIIEAKNEVGTLFDETDYPHPDEVKQKFYFDWNLSPIADERDFRVQLGEQEIEKLKTDTERRMTAAIVDATADLWTRLAESVQAVKERLDDTDGRIYVAIFENLKGVCEVLPKLNIGGDARLDTMALEITNTFRGVKIDDLRDNKDLRREKSEQVDALLEKMKGYTS